MARIIKTIGLASGDVLSLSVMSGDTYLDSNVSIPELNDLINSPILRPRYRIFLLHPDETVDYQIPDEDILLSGSSYSEQYQNGQRRSLSFSLYNTDKNIPPQSTPYGRKLNSLSIWVLKKMTGALSGNAAVFMWPRH